MKRKLLLLTTFLGLSSMGAYAQCHANLSYTTTGNKVSFTNLSTPGNPGDSTYWSFGDGQYSASTNTEHVYNNPGTYTVHLINSPIGCWDDTTFNVTITLPPCVDSFVVNLDPISGSKVALEIIGGATPGTNYTWSLGDGNTVASTADSIQYPYGQAGLYTIRLTSVNGSCTGYYERRILAGNMNLDFTHTLAPTNAVTLTASYTALSNLTIMPIWKEGSANLGTGNTKTLTYPNPGIHTYTLSVNYNQPVAVPNYITHKSPVTKVIWVGANAIDVTVHNYLMDSLIDSVKIWLIQYDSAAQTLTAVDSMMKPAFSPYAYGRFVGMANGTYLVKAMAAYGANANNWLPTYDSANLSWSTARNIVVANGLTFSNISLIAGTTPGGPGFIGGSVLMGANKTSGIGDPVAGVTMFLQKPSGDNVAYAITGADGKYSFSNIPLGIYNVVPEMLNRYGHAFGNIVLTAAGQEKTAINFKTDHDQIVPQTPTSVTAVDKTTLLTVYPNPASDMITIQGKGLGDGALTIRIFDAAGKLVMAQQKNTQNGSINIPVNISQLASGIYNIQVNGKQVSEIHKLVKP